MNSTTISSLLMIKSRKDKDKDEDPFTGSDRGLKKRKTSKDAESAKGPKAKESQSGSSKGDKSELKSFRNSIQSEEPEFEVADLDMPYDQEENLGNDDVEPKEKVASKRDWFTKPTHPQEPTDPDSNVDKTPQQGQNQYWLMTLASSAEKPLKTFDELMSTLIDFSAFIINGLKINNLTQETLLGPTFRLLKGTRSNYTELEYDFEECYKALSEKLDWENPEGDDYPFDLTKPLPLVMSRNCQKVHVDYFFNNDLKYLQGGILTMTYTNSLTKTKAALYDLPGIETFYAYARGLQSRHDVYYMKRILAVTQVEVIRKHGYGYLKEIVVRRADNILYRFKEGDSPHLRINDVEDMLLLVVQNQLQSSGGEHPSDTYVFTVKMEILLDPTSNKLLVGRSHGFEGTYKDGSRENGENILRSIDEGPFKMGKFRETLAEGAEADIRAMNILLQGLPKDIYILINHYTKAKDIWDNVKMLLEGSELTKDERELQLYDDFEHFCQNKGETIREYFVRVDITKVRENGVVLDEEQLLFIADGQDINFDDDVDAPPVQDLALNVDNIFQYHEVHEMQNDVQQNYVVDSDDEYTSDSNIISYEQYVKDNAVQVVQNAYDEPIGDLDMIEDKVDNLSPQSTPQVLPSFEVYTPPVTYPDELEEIIGIPIKVEPLDETPLEDLDLNTCNHDITLSSREI
ncbi:hypothetical protein Tco_1377450, partial [Tanacetum coccineum]